MVHVNEEKKSPPAPVINVCVQFVALRTSFLPPIMERPRTYSSHSYGSQCSRSSGLPARSSSPWPRRDSSPLPENFGQAQDYRDGSSLESVNTQVMRREVTELIQAEVERAGKRRCDATLDMQREGTLTVPLCAFWWTANLHSLHRLNQVGEYEGSQIFITILPIC